MFLIKILFVFFLTNFYDVQSTTQAYREMRRPSSRFHPKSCISPNFIHGRYRSKQNSKVIKFICYRGYSLVGNRYATCENGEWDTPTPICVKPGCQLIPVENALNLPSYNNSWVVFFCLPGFEMVGSGTIYCDGNNWNGTYPSCVATKTAPILSCDFETPDLCGWQQDIKHDFDWVRYKGSTPSSFLNTGPKYDHTLGGNNGSSLEGYYMYIESTSRAINQSARLISPIYDAEVARNGCFSFYYHMYGMSMGGLRVYQKPDSMSLFEMLLSTKEERDKYLLFEKWGNQLNVWYRSVTKLTDFSEDFQIIVEGIRGYSYLSDIAIDDVAILKGENCTSAMNSALTPPSFSQSCAGRCNLTGHLPAQDSLVCSCNTKCFAESTCCHDFVDVCIYGTSDDSDPDSTTEDNPQTQKLVALSTVVTTTTSTAKPTSPTTSTRSAITTRVTIPKVPTHSTMLLPTTTSKSVPTTKVKTTKTITTTNIHTLVFKSTTSMYNATGIITKDNKTEVKPTRKVVSTTTVTPVRTTKFIITTTSKPTTKVTKTTNSYDASERGKMEKERMIETKTLRIDKKENKPKSGVNTAVAVIIGIALCVCAAFLIHAARGAKGREIIARMRGRIQSDPEVRYLSAHMDE